MKPLGRILSNEAGPFWQFAKYGLVGILSTLVQVAVFYALASTVLPCLAADDWAVRLAGLPFSDAPDSVRAARFAISTVAGFTVANVFCWVMNRAFVFRPGKFGRLMEFALFFGAAAFAMALATLLSWLLIHAAGLMTTIATVLEVAVSFAVNYAIRKKFIFRG